jgi:hypothetical protein
MLKGKLSNPLINCFKNKKLDFRIPLTCIFFFTITFSFSQSLNIDKTRGSDTIYNKKLKPIINYSVISANQTIIINGKKYVSPNIYGYGLGVGFRYKFNTSVSIRGFLANQISKPIYLFQNGNDFKYEFSSNNNKLLSNSEFSILMPLDLEYSLNKSALYLISGIFYSYNLSNINKPSIYNNSNESGLRFGIGNNFKKKFVTVKLETIYSRGTSMIRENTREDIKISKLNNDFVYFNLIIEPNKIVNRKKKKRFNLNGVVGEKVMKTD